MDGHLRLHLRQELPHHQAVRFGPVRDHNEDEQGGCSEVLVDDGQVRLKSEKKACQQAVASFGPQCQHGQGELHGLGPVLGEG
eukprot:2931733-Lingulodinium_polyedra.AAC.1